MAITDAQYAVWLDDGTAQRVTLYNLTCKSGGAEVTRRVSNRAYSLAPAATPYLALVAADLEVTQSISLEGDAKLSAGDLGLHNFNGQLNGWLSDIWTNRTATVMVGDVRWPIADFRTVFIGTQADIARSGRNGLVIKFRDIMQNLNTPIIEAKLSGDVLRPGAFGEAFNVTPKYDATTARWYYGAGASEGLAELRTDGKKRTDFIDDPATSSFVFTGAVGPGAVTCTVQGDKTDGIYRNTIASLIQMIVTSYGKASTRLTAADIDTASFAAFETANPQPVGLYLTDRITVLTACAQLASSKGAQLIPSPLGKLRLIQYAIPTSATTVIRLADQVHRSLVPKDRTSVLAAVKVGGCRNYTPQPNLGTSLPPAHKELFKQEWRSATSISATTRDDYKLTTEATQRDTCLIDDADTQAEADRLLTIVSVPHTPYEYKGTPNSLLRYLGEPVQLFGDIDSLATGAFGLITQLTTNYGTCRATVEVTV
jgi:hypothetical protein